MLAKLRGTEKVEMIRQFVITVQDSNDNAPVYANTRELALSEDAEIGKLLESFLIFLLVFIVIHLVIPLRPGLVWGNTPICLNPESSYLRQTFQPQSYPSIHSKWCSKHNIGACLEPLG